MKISAIIPTLNEQAHIAESISSTFHAGADEVIVVDGNSTDETVAIATPLASQILSTGPGRGHQLNQGYQVATGDVILFVHADCEFAANTFEQIRKRFNSTFAYGAFRQRICSPKRIYRLVEWGNAVRAKYRRMPYGDQGIFVHREILQQIGGIPCLPLMEDVALSQQLGKISRPLLLPGPINVSPRRWEKNGVLRQTWQNWILFTRFQSGASVEKLAETYGNRRP